MTRLCRHCAAPLGTPFLDLGMSPLANRYLGHDELTRMEPFYPLQVYFCDHCYLVQLEQFESPEEIFGDYAYFSSYSDSWLQHAREYTDKVVARFGLGPSHYVVELASNDGYLLRNFTARGIPVLGIEPARNVAQVAEAAGIPTLTKFFGVQTATELVDAGQRADLLLGNNVLAHVPDVNDFVGGMKLLLGPHGVITMEFPHLAQLMENNQFDTIYHEHFSYFSFLAVERLFATHGLTIWDVEELPTHGGSLRIYGRHAEDDTRAVTAAVNELRARELVAGYDTAAKYADFAQQVRETKNKLLEFCIAAKRDGKSIAGYGAPAKGNTLLNYCGIRNEYIDFTVDRSPHKQGTFLPGTHIPIRHPDRLTEERPDYVLILPWNLKDEIISQMEHVRDWGGKFVVPIPEVAVS
jgi:C-methyltransferase-like protein/putative zinc binding protein/methyltransferase family protein